MSIKQRQICPARIYEASCRIWWNASWLSPNSRSHYHSWVTWFLFACNHWWHYSRSCTWISETACGSLDQHEAIDCAYIFSHVEKLIRYCRGLQLYHKYLHPFSQLHQQRLHQNRGRRNVMVPFLSSNIKNINISTAKEQITRLALQTKIGQFCDKIGHDQGIFLVKEVDLVQCLVCDSTFKLHKPGQITRLKRHINGETGSQKITRHMRNLLYPKPKGESIDQIAWLILHWH